MTKIAIFYTLKSKERAEKLFDEIVKDFSKDSAIFRKSRHGYHFFNKHFDIIMIGAHENQKGQRYHHAYIPQGINKEVYWQVIKPMLTSNAETY